MKRRECPGVPLKILGNLDSSSALWARLHSRLLNQEVLTSHHKVIIKSKSQKNRKPTFFKVFVIENCVCVVLAGGECDAWKPMSWKYFSCAVGGAINSNSLITGCDKTLQYPPRFSHNTLLRGEDRVIMGKSLSCTSKTWNMFAVVLLLHFLIPLQWIDLIFIIKLAKSEKIKITFIYKWKLNLWMGFWVVSVWWQIYFTFTPL